MSKQEYILKVKGLAAGYPGLTVLQKVNLELEKGEVLAVIGQNGSGKSTLLKTLCGLLPKKAGVIQHKGTPLNGIAPHQLPTKGISYFAQGGLIMPALTVREHLELAGSCNGKKLREAHYNVTIDEFPKLHEMKSKRAGNLSGGERQMLSFAILLMQDTGTWLLDEPTAGLAPEMVAFTMAFLERANNDRGKTILLVEHNMEVAFRLAGMVAITTEGTLTEPFNKADFLAEGFLDTFVYN